jgi:hypothetical protein
MALTVDMIRAYSSDNELFDVLSDEIQNRFPDIPTERIYALRESLPGCGLLTCWTRYARAYPENVLQLEPIA